MFGIISYRKDQGIIGLSYFGRRVNWCHVLYLETKLIFNKTKNPHRF